jgi:hypothetical protein
MAALAQYTIAGNHGNRPDRGNGPPDKVLICHVDDVVELEEGEEFTTDRGEEFTGPGTVTVRHVIEVAEPAVDAHLGHGDELAEEADEELEAGDPCSTFEPADSESGTDDSESDA